MEAEASCAHVLREPCTSPAQPSANTPAICSRAASDAATGEDGNGQAGKCKWCKLWGPQQRIVNLGLSLPVHHQSAGGNLKCTASGCPLGKLCRCCSQKSRQKHRFIIRLVGSLASPGLHESQDRGCPAGKPPLSGIQVAASLVNRAIGPHPEHC